MGPHAGRPLRSGHVHLPRTARRLRRRHLAELRRRHPAGTDRAGLGRQHLHRISRPCRGGLHHICVEAPDAESFDAALVDTERHGAPVVQQGVMPGGMRFAYVSAEAAGVPYIEIAHIPPEIRAFFDYVKREQR